MPNSILIVAERFARGGLETHILSEIACLTAQGWDVHLAIGELDDGASLPAGLAESIVGLEMRPTAPAGAVAASVRRLCKHVRTHRIGIVHAHPFTSCLVGFLVAGQTGAALVHTLHGPLSLAPAYGPTYDALLRKLVLPSSGLVVCVSDELAMLARLAGTAGNTVVIPNPIAMPQNANALPALGRAAVAARLDPEKIPGIRDFLAKANRLGLEEVAIFGEGRAKQEFQAEAAANPAYPRTVFKGWSDRLVTELQGYAVVAGMGRVALEAGAANQTVVLVGYDGVKGLLDRERFQLARYWNFSGRGLATVDGDDLARQAVALRADPERFALRPLIERDYTDEQVWRAFAERASALEPVDKAAAALLMQSIARANGKAVPWLQAEAIRRDVLGSPDANPVSAMKARLAAAQADGAALRLEAAELRERLAQESELRSTAETAAQAEARTALAMSETARREASARAAAETASAQQRAALEAASAAVQHAEARLAEADERHMRETDESRRQILIARDELRHVRGQTGTERLSREQRIADMARAAEETRHQSTTAIGNLEAQVADLERQRADQESRASGLERQLTERESRIIELQNQAADLERQRADQESRISGLEAQLTEREGQTHALQGQVADLERQRADRESRISGLEGQLTERESQVIELQKQLADGDGRIADKDGAIVTLERQLADLAAQKGGLERDLAGVRAEADELWRRSLLNDGLQKEIAERDQTIQSLRAKVVAIEDRLKHQRRDDLELVSPLVADINLLRGARSWKVVRMLHFLRTEVWQRGERGRATAIAQIWGRLARGRPFFPKDPLAAIAARAELLAGRVSAERAGSLSPSAGAGKSMLPTAPHQLPDRADLVSIVLPVYNHAAFLPAALDSVLAQDYPHWQLIVVNDGSSDGFGEAIAPYLADPRIVVLEQPNQKLPSALNNGFAEARGAFFTWTSADNVMLPNQLSVLVAALRRNPTAGFVYADYEAIGDDGKPLADKTWRHHNRPDGSSLVRLPGEATVENLHVSGDNFIGAAFMWRSDVHAVVGQHDETVFGGEDYDFWLRMHMVTPFAHVPDIVYQYRVHDNTLNARAQDLGIGNNVRSLLDADAWRRESFLKAANALAPAAASHWRDVRQYEPSVSSRIAFRRYSETTGPWAHDELVHVLIVDVPPEKIRFSILENVDIFVTADLLCANWLREVLKDRHPRIFIGDIDDVREIVVHAAAMCLYDRRQRGIGRPLTSRPLAPFSVRQHPRHVLLMIGHWRSGGMEQVLLDLAAGLAQRGVRVSVATAEEAAPPDLVAAASRHGFASLGFDGRADELEAFVRGESVDWINYHHCFLGADRFGNDPSTVTTYTIHNTYAWFDEATRVRFRAGLAPMRSFVAVSRQAASYARRWLALDPARVAVIPNGTTLSGADDGLPRDGARAGERPQDSFGFLQVATFNRVKLQDRTLRAFARISDRFPHARLTLVGVPSDQAFHLEVGALCARLGLADRVAILPGISRDEAVQLMRREQCLLLPSLVEGWSIALMEAAIVGLPFIATEVGSAREIADLTGAGILVQPPGPYLVDMEHAALWHTLQAPSAEFEEKLADAMAEMIREYPRYRLHAERAADRTTDLCRSDLMVDHYLDHYHRVRGLAGYSMPTHPERHES